MVYHAILNTIYSVLIMLVTLIFAHQVVFYISGLFKKKYPESENKLSYGILICARNEEKVIGNLISSIRSTNYDQTKLKIYVMAHNCNDRTAYFAEQAGATKVYSYDNSNERTKGFALKKLIENLKEDELLLENDGYYIFDADNIVTNDYFDKMNNVFNYYDKKRIVTSYRSSKNFAENFTTACYGVHFAFECRILFNGRTNLNCSARVQGTGYLVNTDVIKDGWSYLTLTEDWELTADQILKNNKVVYCDEAMYYDEQPVDNKTMWKQKERWSKGCYMVANTRFKKMLDKLFDNKDKKNKISTYDFAVNIFPTTIITFFLFICFTILSLFEPLFWDVTVGEVIMKILPIILESFFVLYLYMIINPILVFIFDRKRLPKMSLLMKLGVIFYFPIFKIIEMVIAVEAFFNKNIGWTVIKHANDTSIEDINSGKIKITEKEKRQSIFAKQKEKCLNAENMEIEESVKSKNVH